MERGSAMGNRCASLRLQSGSQHSSNPNEPTIDLTDAPQCRAAQTAARSHTSAPSDLHLALCVLPRRKPFSFFQAINQDADHNCTDAVSLGPYT